MNLYSAIAVIAMSVAHAVSASPIPDPAVAEAELRAINHRFVSAFSSADPTFMEELADSDFVLTESNGAWLDRADFLRGMREVPNGLRVSYDDVRVRLMGSAALIHGVFQAVDAQGGVRRIRYTDAYRWDGSRWRLVNAQNTKIKNGMPSVVRSAPKPVSAPWQGKDRQGADPDVLRDLNENYVDAFRRADVSWYDAHLTPDYVVINSDGTMDDRAAALVEFSKPVFAEHIASFPVDKVRIRQFGDIAFIHAENDFTMKDGRKGINRYTDIWKKLPGGEWRCVAAHITTFKPLMSD